MTTTTCSRSLVRANSLRSCCKRATISAATASRPCRESPGPPAWQSWVRRRGGCRAGSAGRCDPGRRGTAGQGPARPRPHLGQQSRGLAGERDRADFVPADDETVPCGQIEVLELGELAHQARCRRSTAFPSPTGRRSWSWPRRLAPRQPDANASLRHDVTLLSSFPTAADCTRDSLSLASRLRHEGRRGRPAGGKSGPKKPLMAPRAMFYRGG